MSTVPTLHHRPCLAPQSYLFNVLLQTIFAILHIYTARIIMWWSSFRISLMFDDVFEYENAKPHAAQMIDRK